MDICACGTDAVRDSSNDGVLSGLSGAPTINWRQATVPGVYAVKHKPHRRTNCRLSEYGRRGDIRPLVDRWPGGRHIL